MVEIQIIRQLKIAKKMEEKGICLDIGKDEGLRSKTRGKLWRDPKYLNDLQKC